MLLETQPGLLTGAPGFSSTAFPCCLGFSQGPKRCQYTALRIPHFNCQNTSESAQFKGKGKRLIHHIHHIYGKKILKSFIIGPLINPIVAYKETSLRRLNPSRVQRNWFTTFGSSSEQSENFSHYLESDFKGASWGYWKDQGLCRPENSYGL